MRLKSFDLNLLMVLDALLAERSTTRAAKRLNVSQPSVSNALARLRAYFEDDLLTHVGHRLIPTTLGESLKDSVHELVVRASATLDRRPGFNPRDSTRTFTLMGSDYASAVLIAEVARRAEELAPGVSFEIRRLEYPAHEQIESGEIDLLVMPEMYLSRNHDQETLYSETFVCVIWRGNTRVQDEIGIDDLSKLRHVIADPGASLGRMPNIIDRWFDDHIGWRRRIAARVVDFTAIPQFVRGTNRVAIVHGRLAQYCAAEYELKILPLPVSMPLINISMQWHRLRSSDSGVQWLRSLMKTVALAQGSGLAAKLVEAAVRAPAKRRSS
ncbi:MAG TPA: LysR family transcriptional regulator [Steroidobacteraceae bacterium]|nr:LysR family transcriptional regulator [Steroidobacteraceae bacterium]